MSLRYPATIKQFTATGTSGSNTFTLQNLDFNVIVAKLNDTTLAGTSPTLDVYLQTSDDGGVTFYDLAHFVQLTGTSGTANAYFAKIGDLKGSGGYIGTSVSLTLGAGKVSGLPLLGYTMKAVWTYGGTIGSSNMTLTLSAVDEDIR